MTMLINSYFYNSFGLKFNELWWGVKIEKRRNIASKSRINSISKQKIP